jgi:hypothetical protein
MNQTCYNPMTQYCCWDPYAPGTTCYYGQTCCNGTCCDNATECCVGGVCQPKCGTGCCSSTTEHCCGNHCCYNDQTCCGDTCCFQGQFCCGNTSCCEQGFQQCCGKTCCNPGQQCCFDEKCCSNDEKCCPAVPGVTSTYCAQPCQIVDGEDCHGISTFCSGCEMPEVGCSWQANTIIYENVTEKTCNPNGCLGDCSDDEKVCYTQFTCVPFDTGAPLSYCASYSGNPPIPVPPYCASTLQPFECYICVEDAEPGQSIVHKVHNGSCLF